MRFSPVLLTILLACVVLGLTPPIPGARSEDQDENRVVAVQVDKILLVNDNPVVVLSSKDQKSHLLVFIDQFMAQAIQLGLMGYSIERPLTHDLIGILLRRMGARVSKITITDLKDNTYYALISLQVNGTVEEIDARPSDALAIAVRSNAPIFVSRRLMTDQVVPEEVTPVPAPPAAPPDQPKHGA